MRIQTSNRLAHLQAEFMEISQQTECLQNQVEPKRAQIAQMEQYLCRNSADRHISQQYKKCCRELSTLCNKISKNKGRLMTLSRSIEQENIKASMGYVTRRRTRRMY